MSDSIPVLAEELHAHGQGHVLRFWGALRPSERAALEADLAGLDLEALSEAFQSARRRANAASPEMSPPPVLPSAAQDPAGHARARERGEALLSDGAVAALVVAGGQGTRLGHPGPKGGYPIGPVSTRSLFALHAQRLRARIRRHGHPIPWYVMTSPATDAATRALFAANDHYGLDPGDVFFFVQRELPALDFEGRLILSEPHRLARSPDGHGGVLGALAATGALSDLADRGIEAVSYFQVDNPLVQPCDPVHLGWHALAESDWTAKAVRKRAPEERVGTLAELDGGLHVVEYLEIREPARSARTADGELRFWAGAIGVHVLSRRFLERVAPVADRLLPLHLSKKKVPFADDEGRAVAPAEPNAYKLERFVFDALPEAARAQVLEVNREQEYAPLKNASGGESPETARRALDACARRWLDEVGIALPDGAERVEIDHAVALDAEDLAAAGWNSVEDAGPAILTSTNPIGGK